MLRNALLSCVGRCQPSHTVTRCAEALCAFFTLSWFDETSASGEARKPEQPGRLHYIITLHYGLKWKRIFFLSFSALTCIASHMLTSPWLCSSVGSVSSAAAGVARSSCKSYARKQCVFFSFFKKNLQYLMTPTCSVSLMCRPPDYAADGPRGGEQPADQLRRGGHIPEVQAQLLHPKPPLPPWAGGLDPGVQPRTEGERRADFRLMLVWKYLYIYILYINK